MGLSTLLVNKMSYEKEDLDIIKSIIETRNDSKVIEHFKKVETKNKTIEQQKTAAADTLIGKTKISGTENWG